MFRPQRFGRYLLVKRLSTGGMAEVFLARAPDRAGGGPLMAIKRILPWANEETEFTNMFIDEACISAGLKHPNIARVHEFGQEQGHYFLAMEYVSGRDLRSVLTYLQRTGATPPPAMVLVVGMRLAQALDYAHKQKRPDGTPMEIIHRDVSPPNVLLTYDGGVKLIDFGIAKASSRATRTRAGRLKGKIAYMSPEQVQGKSIDQRADLFSLGVLLYELVTARALFHGKNQIETMHQVRRANVPPPSTLNPEVPKEVDAILLRALARDREQRFQSAAELREEIQRYLVRSRSVFGPEHLMRWMHEHFEGALQEERHTLGEARGLKIEDYPEEAGEDEEPTPVTDMPPEARQRRAPFEASDDMQIDLKATMLDGRPPAGMVAEQPLAADRELPPAAPGDDTPIEGTPALVPAAEQPVSAAPASLSPTFDDAWTPAGGMELSSGEELDPDEAPTELAIPAFMPQPELQDTIDTGGMIPPVGGLMDDATMVDRPLFPESRTPAPSPIAPGDNRDRAVAGGELQIPTSQDHGGPKVEPIAPGSNRDRMAVGGSVSVPSQHDIPVVPELQDISRVSVEGIDDGNATGYFRRQDPTPVSPPAGAPAPMAGQGGPGAPASAPAPGANPGRFTSSRIIILAATLTLVVVGVITVLTLLPGGKGGASRGGTVVVTSTPPAACTISLDDAARGLLSPGASVNLAEVPAGGHYLAVNCVGYMPFSTDIKVMAGEVTVVEARLKKEDR